MTYSAIYFSLVLYKHSASEILPLLRSLGDIYDLFPDSFLLIHDNSGFFDSALVQSIDSYLPPHSFSYNFGENIGFGAGHNKNFNLIDSDDQFLFIVVNPDISFHAPSILDLVKWLDECPSCSCVAPLIVNGESKIQFSAKRDPTILSLLLGRFSFLTNISFLSTYDRWHKNLDLSYESDIIASSYLSGCFLMIPGHFFVQAGGFCESYFLHLEDADIVRRLSALGPTFHNPIGRVVHQWARGSHNSFAQTIHLIKSVIVYISIWSMPLY